jgi:magnesium transporter
LILATIRTYEQPLEELQLQYDRFEEEILSIAPEKLASERIYQFRRKVFLLKRLLKQTGDALYRSKDFWETNPSLLQDLRENIDQIYFQLDDLTGNFEHLFELHIAILDQRANEVMKVLTIFSTILLPLNFIASFYGMNFEHLPGLHSVHAFTTIVILMLAISIGAIWYFKQKGWFYSWK